MSATTNKKAGAAKGGGAKTGTGKGTAGKAAAGGEAKAPALKVVAAADEAQAAPAAAGLRLKDLLARVTATTGAKPKEVREIVLATLTEIGQTLGRGEGVNLPEFGKAKVARRVQDDAGGAALVVKVRQGGPKAGKEGLAEAGE